MEKLDKREQEVDLNKTQTCVYKIIYNNNNKNLFIFLFTLRFLIVSKDAHASLASVGTEEHDL